MKVRVRLFASLAQNAGWREKVIEVAEGSTAASVLAQLKRGPLLTLISAAPVLFAINCEHVSAEHPVADNDELGLFPPVSGGSGSEPRPVPDDRRAELTNAKISAGRLANLVRAPGCGAVVTFEGTVRDLNDGEEVTAIEYETYGEMAGPMLRSIRAEVEARWPGVRLALVHRTGRLEVGEASVAVACAAPHRREAFAACRLAMDRIKESLPVWKHEEGVSGTKSWR